MARQHISRASHRECLSWEGDHGGVGMLGMVAGQVWGVSATLKCVWGQKTRHTSEVSAATAWRPHRDHGTPGPCLDHKGLQKSRLGGVGEQIFGAEEEKSSAGGVSGIIFLGMLLTDRMLVC